MIERSFIHVGGQPGAGKTTLVEHLLRGFDGLVSVARCQRDDTLGDFEETRPAGNPELGRYREAGAADAILYRFPERHARDESFFLTEMMEDYSNAVILEGKEPVPYADVSVYVAEPPDDGGSLLVRKTRDRAREQKEKLDAMEHLLSEPGGVADLRRLRKDEAVFQDILAPLGNRVPITAVAADLTDPRDRGTRKGLTRILRSMKGR